MDKSIKHEELGWGPTTDCRKYGSKVPLCAGDMIEMHLDVLKLELSYSINGKNYGKAYVVDKDEYRAVIMMTAPGETWQFLSKYNH